MDSNRGKDYCHCSLGYQLIDNRCLLKLPVFLFDLMTQNNVNYVLQMNRTKRFYINDDLSWR